MTERPDLSNFWRDYHQELLARVTNDHGTGQAYDWQPMGTSREDIPLRVERTVLKMRAAMSKYPPSFQSNVAMKTVAKRYGFTSAAALREAILAAEASP